MGKLFVSWKSLSKTNLFNQSEKPTVLHATLQTRGTTLYLLINVNLPAFRVAVILNFP